MHKIYFYQNMFGTHQPIKNTNKTKAQIRDRKSSGWFLYSYSLLAGPIPAGLRSHLCTRRPRAGFPG